MKEIIKNLVENTSKKDVAVGGVGAVAGAVLIIIIQSGIFPTYEKMVSYIDTRLDKVENRLTLLERKVYRRYTAENRYLKENPDEP